jgi:hypothetical protein
MNPPDFDELSNVCMSIVGSEALSKSCADPFDYALKLKTGEVVMFTEARVLNNEWIHLTLKPYDEQPDKNRVPYPADRGMDVRISEIVWVMDAPNGS